MSSSLASIAGKSSPTDQALTTISQNVSNGNNSNKYKSEEKSEQTLGSASAEFDSNSVETENVPDTILCILWKNGNLGAAYYNIFTQQLYMLSDMTDPAPQFPLTRNILRENNIKQVITMGTPCDIFVKFVIDLIVRTDDATFESDDIRQIPQNLSLLSFKEYSYTACQYKIFSLPLPDLPENCTDGGKEVYFHSLLNFENKFSIHALGALIQYVEINWAHINPTEQLRFLHINQVSMGNHVYIDKHTYEALQIFRKRFPDAGFKQGRNSGFMEGESVFKLFSAYCKSAVGFKCLKRILRNPINDIDELQKRLDFIDFASQPVNAGFIQAIQSSIKKMFPLEKILVKVQHTTALTNDWEMLYQTIYHMLFLYEQTMPHRATVFLFTDLDAIITANLYALESCIKNTIEFSSNRRCRPSVKPGVDEGLDKKRIIYQEIGDHLTAAAKFMMNQLPEVLTECTLVYIPEMGHLLVTKKNDRLTEPNQLEHLGFQFMFQINDTFHFKTAVCKELDKQIGNIQEDIISHEIRIIQRMSNLVLKFNKDIREPLEIIALIDCLIAMAIVAKEKNFVRPALNTDNIIDIEQGQHVLLDAQVDNAVPNSFKSGGTHSKVKILTGANGCGKSVYLKQTALLVYLAHVGSYVPAKSANICMISSIHCRIQVNESAALRLSAFMIDISQMAQVLYNAKPTSLVIIDEFGKGTTEQDALSLLIAALRKYIGNESLCPHILVSTHLQEIKRHLSLSPLLSYHTFDWVYDADNIVFLYKITDGVSRSFTFEVAEAAGLDKNIVARAREIYKAICEGRPIKPMFEQNPHGVEYYLNIDIPELDE